VSSAWNEYVVLADDLAAHHSEAWQRSAVSRAYYGAFNSARRWVEANVMPIDHGSAHRQVWLAFRAPVRATERTRADWIEVGELGDELRRLRNQADYLDDVPNLDRHAPEAVVTAKRILALLPDLELESGEVAF
jgi:hypothetical protein